VFDVDGKTSAIRVAIVLAAGSLTLGACTVADSGDSAQSSSATPTAAAIALGGEQPLDDRAQAYKDALIAAGIPAGQSNSTTLVLGEGICARLADATPEPEILANLAPLAEYTASTSQGTLDGDQVARIYLETAKSDYC
jgi:hypothetical protein